MRNRSIVVSRTKGMDVRSARLAEFKSWLIGFAPVGYPLDTDRSSFGVVER